MAILVCFIVIGFWLRVHNLGALGLIVDEGHQALAVDAILTRGYPLAPSGIVYTSTTLAYQYIQSLSALVFGVNEFALRLPGVLFSVASIPLIYLFGSSLFTTKVGLLSAFLLTFSVWEIELSRFARPYSAFQCFYLLGLLTFYKGFIKGERLYQWLVFPIFLFTFMLHQLGATLLMAFWVPFFIDSYAPLKKRSILLYGGLTFGALFLYYSWVPYFQSRFSTVPVRTPIKDNELSFIEGIRQTIKTQFQTSEVGLIKQLYVQDDWLFPLLCTVFVAIVAFLIYQIYTGKSDRVHSLLALPIIACCFLYQFGLACILFCLYVLFTYRDSGSLKTTPYIVIYISTSFTFLFWLTYATQYAVEYFSFAKYFWDYPKLYGYFLRWMFEGWPRFTLVAGIGLLVMGYLFLRDRTRSEYIYVVLLCLLLPTFASFLYWPYYVPRYFFHMYPLLIVVFAFTLCTLSTAMQRRGTMPGQTLRLQSAARTVVGGFALVFSAVLLSQDVYPAQALAINSRTYSTTKNPIKASQNWETFHQDYKTPGLSVKAHMTPHDIVVVLGASHAASIIYHYVGRVDYVLMLSHEMPGNKSGPVLALETEKGLVHYTTGAIVLKDALEFELLLSRVGMGRIWIIADLRTLSPDKVRQLRSNLVFSGQDTLVYLISPSITGCDTSKLVGSLLP